MFFIILFIGLLLSFLALFYLDGWLAWIAGIIGFGIIGFFVFSVWALVVMEKMFRSD